MTGPVISHRAPHRKRRGSAAWRAVEIAAGLAALAGAIWVERRASPAPAPVRPALFAPMEARAPEPSTVLPHAAAPESAPAPMQASRRPRSAGRGVPLDGGGHDFGDGLEILSAAELDTISQARP